MFPMTIGLRRVYLGTAGYNPKSRGIVFYPEGSIGCQIVMCTDRVIKHDFRFTSPVRRTGPLKVVH